PTTTARTTRSNQRIQSAVGGRVVSKLMSGPLPLSLEAGLEIGGVSLSLASIAPAGGMVGRAADCDAGKLGGGSERALRGGGADGGGGGAGIAGRLAEGRAAGSITRSRNSGNLLNGSQGPFLSRLARTPEASPIRPSLSDRRMPMVLPLTVCCVPS